MHGSLTPVDAFILLSASGFAQVPPKYSGRHDDELLAVAIENPDICMLGRTCEAQGSRYE